MHSSGSITSMFGPSWKQSTGHTSTQSVSLHLMQASVTTKVMNDSGLERLPKQPILRHLARQLAPASHQEKPKRYNRALRHAGRSAGAASAIRPAARRSRPAIQRSPALAGSNEETR